MDIQKYISSGILELYVCGALPEKEMAEVCAIVEKYPELQQEVEKIEATFIQLSSQNITPSSDLKNKITTIGKEDISSSSDAKVVPIESQPYNSNRWMAAASIGLLLVSMLANFFLFRSLKNTQNTLAETQKKLASLEAEKLRIAENASFIEEKYSEVRQQFEEIRDPNMKVIALEGQAVSPDSKAIVYWNPEKNTVFVDGNQLPAPPQGKVYQLWSLKLNPLTPNDAGLLSNYTVNEDNFFQLKDVETAEGFAITLEPEGGSASPTLEQLYVLGTL